MMAYGIQNICSVWESIENKVTLTLNPNRYYMYPMVKHCIYYFQYFD